MDALVGERAARLERLARRLKTNEARLLLIDEVLGPHIDAVVKNYDPSRIRVSHGAATLAADIEQHRPDFALYFKMRALPREQTELLFRAPDLAWLHLSSVGTDHVADWRDFPVTVTNALGVLSRFSADYAITSMLALNIDLHRYAEQKPDRLWRQFLWQPLEKQTALVVGVGAIGGIVASRAKALGMRVIGVRANPRAHPGVDEMVKT
ncbi:MAG: NAD(P)-dependent oxidoreductase, partial [Pseudorhodoplanes sp.]